MNGTKKAFALLLVLVAIAAITMFLTSGITVAQVITIARGVGAEWWAPLAYFAIYAICNVLFIPTQLLSIVAAIIWGWAIGATIELFAATAGAMLPYALARWLKPPGAMKYRDVIEREGFTFLLLLRLVPIVPYTALNYAAGLTPIRPAPYAAATFLGMIPSAYIFAFFVDSIANGVLKPGEVFWRIVIAGVLLSILVLATRLAASRLRPGDGTPDPAAERPPAAGPSPE